MGRKVCSFDRGIFADWNFSENKYFENINPKTQNAVAEFFKKTLSLNPKDRFVDTDSLIDALKEIKDLSEEKVYIDMQSSLPASISSFVGRKKELEKIETAFSNGKRMIFLQGFGGIGKSELAKKYASIHESEYNKVIFLKYSASLKDTLNQINIHTMEETSFDEKEEDLKKLLTSDCLLIIDNFNVDIYADDYLDELAKYTVNIIFTTRTDFSEYDCETAELINIDCLDKETLLLLFLRESALIEADDEDLVYILKTLKLYQYHTLFVRPLAHKIKKRRYTPRKLYDISKKDFLDDKQISPVRKDGKVTQETLNSLAKKLFRLENLNPFEQQVLSDLYILNDIKADIRTYADIICADISQVEKENTLISLVENGVVQEDELNGGLSIHPIIMELVNELFKPDVTSCSDAAKYINTMVDAFLNKKLNSPEIPVTVIRSSANFPLHITNLLSRLDMSISENSDYALDLIFKICSSSIYDYLARQFRDIISAFDKEDIRVKLLNFLCEFTSMFNKSLSAHTAHREEEMVEYIVSFHKEYDDGSDLFGCIFWQMILFYYDYLQNFKSMGWNISLLAKIQKCIKTQNKFGLSLYEYVFDYTNFEVAYIDENENMVDEGNYIFAAENIEKIFTQKQLLAKELGINTEGKTSFEIYMDCIEKVCSDYKNSLIPYVAKHQSNTPFSEDELSAVKTIYEKIKQDDFLTKQMKLDIYLWCCNLSRHLNYLPPSKDTSNPLWDLPLTPVLSFFVKSGLLDEKKELLPIIREFLCVLESGYVGTPNDIDFASKTFFSSFLSDFDKFKKEVERFIEKEITKAKEKINENERVIIFNFPFAPILHKAITEEKAFILSSLLNDYFYKANSLYEKHGNQITFINLDIILSACMNCANAAFKETGEDIYKKEYAKLEKCLKKEY